MADDGVLSARDGALTPSQHLEFTADEGPSNSEDFLADEDESYERDDRDVCGQQMLEYERKDLENPNHGSFDMGGNDHENMSHRQLIKIQCSDLEKYTKRTLDIDNEDHENNSIFLHEVKGRNHVNGSAYVFQTEGAEQVQAITEGQGMCAGDVSDVLQDKFYSPPVVGMEFESYDDAYSYYNCYAKELGFAIRVKSSWTKRNSKEKRGAVLCCNCEGFKTAKEARHQRKETRTGCLAMIRLRLAESNRWRVDEVKLDHNHSHDPKKTLSSKSHKKVEAQTKRISDPSLDVEVRTIKLYRTSTSGSVGHTSVSPAGKEVGNETHSKRLKLKDEDMRALQDFFCQAQLGNPNFLYLMDLNDDGHLRNVFWIDSRSRAAYSYFGDVVAIDTTYLSNKCDVPLLVFVGLNHHGHSILFGCGLLADETLENYVWIFRSWLTCIMGRPPQTVITDQGKAIHRAISEVFPRVHHRLSLPLVMQSILKDLGPLKESDGLQSMLNRTVYGSVRVDEFENSWGAMIERYGIGDLEWLHNMYEDRERWVPAYVKDAFLAGLFMSPAEPLTPFFSGCLNERTSLREFFNVYEAVLQKKHQMEALADSFSLLESSSSLKTPSSLLGSPYELQLSRVYTKVMLDKFRVEVEMISSCVNISQVHASGPVATYLIKEQEIGLAREYRNFEVTFDKATVEVRCICGCFYVYGYLCRHALCVLNYNGVEEIPPHYILPRWRKDYKRLYVLDVGLNAVDISNPVQRYEHLYRRAMQVVEQGTLSHGRYMVAWQAFKESLDKVRLAKGEEHV